MGSVSSPAGLQLSWLVARSGTTIIFRFLSATLTREPRAGQRISPRPGLARAHHLSYHVCLCIFMRLPRLSSLVRNSAWNDPVAIFLSQAFDFFPPPSKLRCALFMSFFSLCCSWRVLFAPRFFFFSLVFFSFFLQFSHVGLWLIENRACEYPNGVIHHLLIVLLCW